MTLYPIAAYIRVSTEQQKEEESHIKQRERIIDWADQQEYGEVDIKFYQDIAISGQADERESYEALMDQYEEHEYVVVRELSRFGRDPVAVLTDIEEIMDSGVEFVSVTEPELDSTSAHGKFMMRMIAAMNGFYADLRREQAIRAAQRRKEKGLPVGRPKKLKSDQRDEVFDLRRKGVSYSAIARVMEDKPGEPHEISRETIRRYCKEAEVEPEERAAD